MWRTLQLWEDQTTHEEEKRTELKLLNAPLAVWRAVLIRCVSCFIKHRGVCLSVCASTFVRDAAQLMRTCCLWFLSGRKALGSGNSADCWSSDLGLALFPTFTLRALRRGNGSVPLSSQVFFFFFYLLCIKNPFMWKWSLFHWEGKQKLCRNAHTQGV